MKQQIEHYTNRAGGKGTIHIEKLLSEQECKETIKMYAKVTIDVNSSIGVHTHIDDGESYYILEGKAKYIENDEEKILTVGDITYTPHGQSHGIENIGDTPLVFMALISKEF